MKNVHTYSRYVGMYALSSSKPYQHSDYPIEPEPEVSIASNCFVRQSLENKIGDQLSFLFAR